MSLFNIALFLLPFFVHAQQHDGSQQNLLSSNADTSMFDTLFNQARTGSVHLLNHHGSPALRANDGQNSQNPISFISNLLQQGRTSQNGAASNPLEQVLQQGRQILQNGGDTSSGIFQNSGRSPIGQFLEQGRSTLENGANSLARILQNGGDSINGLFQNGNKQLRSSAGNPIENILERGRNTFENGANSLRRVFQNGGEASPNLLKNILQRGRQVIQNGGDSLNGPLQSNNLRSESQSGSPIRQILEQGRSTFENGANSLLKNVQNTVGSFSNRILQQGQQITQNLGESLSARDQRQGSSSPVGHLLQQGRDVLQNGANLIQKGGNTNRQTPNLQEGTKLFQDGFNIFTQLFQNGASSLSRVLSPSTPQPDTKRTVRPLSRLLNSGRGNTPVGELFKNGVNSFQQLMPKPVGNFLNLKTNRMTDRIDGFANSLDSGLKGFQSFLSKLLPQ